MSDEPIPLWDGEPSGAEIRHDTVRHDAAGSATNFGTGHASGLTTRRRDSRHECERIFVCFSASDPMGRAEYVECPVFDFSKSGLALEFDRRLAIGTACTIAYRTVSRQPVHVSGSVRHCRDLDGGRYRVGIRLARTLKLDELRPAKRRDGQDIAPGIRARSLRDTDASR
ncbi:MAG: PilZ domain-containing protein [Phycisphaerae bacterium]|nr:PilZ domain-containing protein [Phycisphaerae bacterium]